MRAFCPRGQWASSSIRYQYNHVLLKEHIAEPFHSLLPSHKGFCASEEARLCGAQIWSQVKESGCTFFLLLSQCSTASTLTPCFPFAFCPFTEILRKEVRVVSSSNLSWCVCVLAVWCRRPTRDNWTCLCHETERGGSGSAAPARPLHPGEHKPSPVYIFSLHVQILISFFVTDEI